MVVVASSVSPPNCNASGQGTVGGRVGVQVQFALQLRDEFDNNILTDESSPTGKGLALGLGEF